MSLFRLSTRLAAAYTYIASSCSLSLDNSYTLYYQNTHMYTFPNKASSKHQESFPLELLGLDYRNPPESVDELRRAYLKMAKKYHPDKVAKDASPDEREIASLNFVSTVYLEDKYFAEMLGGHSRDSRKSHIRQPFSRSGSSFSNSYLASYGAQQRGGADASSGYHGESPSTVHAISLKMTTKV